MAAILLMPTRSRRSKAPIQSPRSGLIGFFTSMHTSLPLRQSANSCIAKGLAVVLAPIQRMSMAYSMAFSTCSGVATSVATSIPVSFFTRCSHCSAISPLPSKPPGLVRGFQTPALKHWQPWRRSCCAVQTTCSSVSAEQGPEMSSGSLSFGLKGSGLLAMGMFWKCLFLLFFERK